MRSDNNDYDNDNAVLSHCDAEDGSEKCAK